jgi:hypothetical protein
VSGAIAQLRELRARAIEPEVLRAEAVAAACADDSKGAQLQHRYEMAHERSLRSAIRQLLALEKSGADLPDLTEPEPCPEEALPAEPGPPPPDAPPRGAATAPEPPAAAPTAPGSVGACDLGSIPTVVAAPIGVPNPPSRPAEAADGGGSAP